ncbi:MAG: ROK family protein [Firmicutes bacterium]|nr:ROK family protein [Bacillota bacterium]
MKYLLGVDLGGTNIQVALAERGGKILRSQKFSTEAATGRENVWRNILAGLETVLEQGLVPRDRLAGVGVCTAGFFDYYSRTIISSPNLPGWEGFPLEKRLSQELALPVLVENDANAAAYGEFIFGAGKGKRNMVNVTLGTGIGGGIIIEGEIYRGSGGFAGEIGHLPVLPGGPLCGCGRRGCLECLASGNAIAREGQAVIAGEARTILRDMVEDQEELTAYHVFEAAKDGDREAADIVAKAACYLGRALATVVNLLNPEIITLGGGMAAAGEIIFEPVQRCLKELSIQPAGEMVELLPAVLGEEAGVRGILTLVEQALFQVVNACKGY